MRKKKNVLFHVFRFPVLEIDEWKEACKHKEEEEPKAEKGLLFHPLPKFPGYSKRDIKNFREQLVSSFRPLNCREIRR